MICKIYFYLRAIFYFYRFLKKFNFSIQILFFKYKGYYIWFYKIRHKNKRRRNFIRATYSQTITREHRMYKAIKGLLDDAGSRVAFDEISYEGQSRRHYYA